MGLHIPPPAPVAASLMDGIIRKFKQLNFDERHCGARLGYFEGLPDFAAPRVPRPFLGPASDALDVILALFLLNEEVPYDRMLEVFTEAELYALRAMSLVQVSQDSIKSPINLFPCSGHYLVTDLRVFPKNNLPEFNRIMWLHPESYMLAGLVDRTVHVHRALDLGTGSGIHALMATQHSDEVIGVDINPRAIAFSKFNQRLNNIKNVEFLQGDLYGPVAGMKFDLIVANPPFNPMPSVKAGTDYYSGGASGEEILSRIISGLDEYLTENGVCHIITLLCHQKKGPTYREKLDHWLTGGIKYFDIMAHVADQSLYFRNPSSDYFLSGPVAEREAFLRSEFSKFEFGVISIRRRRAGDGHYYHGPTRAPLPLFDQDARIRFPITQLAFEESRKEFGNSLFATAGHPGSKATA
jgi:methylase of polypeptide subunit release factors